MRKKQQGSFIRLFTLGSFVVMILVNLLANTLPINGITTAQVAKSYENLFTPAGYIFSIWGLIYLLLGLYTFYQLGFFQKGEHISRELMQKIGIFFSLSSLANAAWIFAWHFDNILLSMLLMVVILLCLMFIMGLIGSEEFSPREKFFIRIPFSVYFGWITVATVANATVLLVSLGWKGFGIPEPVWAVVMLIVSMLIGLSVIRRYHNIAYGLVFLWAYAGILVRHVSQSGYGGRYPAVIAAIVFCLAVITSVLISVWLSKRKKAA